MSGFRGGYPIILLGSVLIIACGLLPAGLAADVQSGSGQPDGKDVLRNPFLSLAENENKDSRQVLDDILLSAIFLSDANAYAIIEGKIVRQGDTVNGRKVIAIADEEVVLSDLQGEYVVYLEKK